MRSCAEDYNLDSFVISLNGLIILALIYESFGLFNASSCIVACAKAGVPV
jgi:hypothetical protein